MPAIERDNAEQMMSGPGVYWRDVLHSAMSGKLILAAGVFRITTPTADIYNSAPQALSTWAWDTLSANNKHWDNYTWWNAAVHPSRLTAKEAGLFLVLGSVYFPDTTATIKAIKLIRNGADTNYDVIVSYNAPPESGLNLTALVYLDPTDYLELQALHSGAGAHARLDHFAIVAITPESVTP